MKVLEALKTLFVTLIQRYVNVTFAIRFHKLISCYLVNCDCVYFLSSYHMFCRHLI